MTRPWRAAAACLLRLTGRRPSGRDPLADLTDPREAAAAMMAAVAQWDAAISDTEMDAIRTMARQHFGADVAHANELLASGRWRARRVDNLGMFLRQASGPVIAHCTTREREDLLTMLQHVATAEGKPSAVIAHELQRFGEALRRAPPPLDGSLSRRPRT